MVQGTYKFSIEISYMILYEVCIILSPYQHNIALGDTKMVCSSISTWQGKIKALSLSYPKQKCSHWESRVSQIPFHHPTC
jgi:hypothetical protein